jgi:hypothetical protein
MILETLAQEEANFQVVDPHTLGSSSSADAQQTQLVVSTRNPGWKRSDAC